MKLLAFAASSSKKSINAQLVRHAASLIKSVEIEYLDINDYEMPIFSVDRENEFGILEPAHRFYQKIGQADALLISFAEHNGSFTAAYKSLFDWTSRIDGKVFQGRPMVMLSASPGGRGGASVLEAAVNSAARFGGVVKASLPVPKFYDNFDTQAGKLTDIELQASLRSVLGELFELADDA
jgi:NAD(P)H-dependent FMN reductase